MRGPASLTSRGQQININGANGRSNSYLLDGANMSSYAGVAVSTAADGDDLRGWPAAGWPRGERVERRIRRAGGDGVPAGVLAERVAADAGLGGGLLKCLAGGDVVVLEPFEGDRFGAWPVRRQLGACVSQRVADHARGGQRLVSDVVEGGPLVIEVA